MAQPLRQVRVAARPMKNPFEDGLAPLLAASESARQLRGLRLGEINQFYAATDVEWRGASVAYEIGGGRDPRQTKRQPLHLRVFVPPVVAFAYAGEQFVRQKRQAEHRVNFINEDHQSPRLAGKDDRSNGLDPSLHRTDKRLGRPELNQFVFQTEA